MTTQRFIPVHLPEFEAAEAPSVFDWHGVLLKLREIQQRGTIAPDGQDAILGAIRFMEGRL